jgi:Uma2 family endonuclease
MQEYIDNGVLLGWLIDIKNQNVEIYRPGSVEVLNCPMFVSGEDILPGFELKLEKIWQ